MGWRTNLSLLVLVGGMGGYLVWRGPDEKPADTPPTQLSKRLLPKGIWTARQIRFLYKMNREPIVLDLDLVSQQFRIAEPVRDIASFAVLQSIFNGYQGALLLPGYTLEELAADSELAGKVGLETPRGEIEIRYAPNQEVTGDKIKIEFGNEGFQEDEWWVRVRGGDFNGEIFRVDPALYKLLDKNPDELREHMIFTDPSIGDPMKLRLERRVDGAPQVHRLERRTGRAFQILEPEKARANQDMIGGFLGALASLRIERFISGGRQDPGVANRPKDFVISLAGSGGSETLEVTILESGLYFASLRRRNINFVIEKKGLFELVQWLPVLREKRLITLPERGIQRIELAPGDGSASCAIVRGPSQGFRVEQPVRAAKTNPTPVSELLHALTHLEAQGFVADPPADTGLNDGDDYFTVRIGTEGKSSQMTAIRLGKSAGRSVSNPAVDPTGGKELVYARREDETSVVTLQADMVAAIRRPWTLFVSVEIPPMLVAPFRLEVRVAQSKDPIVYVNKDLAWQPEPGGEEDVDVREFVDALKLMRADGVLPESVIREGVAKQTSADLILRGEQHAKSPEVYHLRLHRYETQVLLQVVGHGGIVYRVKEPRFRQLLDRWLK